MTGDLLLTLGVNTATTSADFTLYDTLVKRGLDLDLESL